LQLGTSAVRIGFASILLGSLYLANPVYAEKYYVRQQGQVFEIDETAAGQLSPEYWEVYFFKRSYTPTPNPNSPGHWGSATNKDREKLLDEVRKDIAFDKSYREAWFCRGDCDSDTVYDNYSGPIAVMETNTSESPEHAEIRKEVARAADLAARVLAWWNNFAKTSRITSIDDLEKLAERRVLNLDPPAIKGFLQNLKMGLEGRAKLQSFMNDVGAQGVQLNQQLASVADDLKAASQAARGINAALVQPKTLWGSQKIGAIAQSIEPAEGLITIRQSRSGDPPGMGQEYSVSRRSIVPDETEINFEDGKWVVTLHSKHPDIVLKITRSDGSTITEHVETADVFFSTEAEARNHADAIASLR
jgi:hypothetical protein